jgi:hypothetical protein
LSLGSATGRPNVAIHDYDLTAADALYLIFFTLAPEFGLTREEVLGLSPEDIASAADQVRASS